MRQWNRLRFLLHKACWSTDGAERGSAPLEFIIAGCVLLVPLVYIVVTLGIVQEHQLGAQTTARQLARVISSAPNAEQANLRAEHSKQMLLTEYGMDPKTTTVDIHCVPEGVACPSAGAFVIVTIRTVASFPLAPSVFSLNQIAAVPVTAQSTQKVSRVWGSE